MNEINGLTAHILLIHLVVIGVPVAALLTVLSAVWPAARLRLGVITPVIAFLALATVPITTRAGEWLQARVFHGFPNPISVVQVYRIGDAGAKASWSSVFCAQPYVGDTCPTS